MHERDVVTLSAMTKSFVETSDFIHIISLRARFLYVSPGGLKKVLEYDDSGELVGRVGLIFINFFF